jgi:signal transduction histidine kinase
VASLFLLLGFGAARFITRPLKALTRWAQQLQAGQPAEIDAHEKMLGQSLVKLVPERLVRLGNEVIDVEKIDLQSMDYRMVTQAMLPLVDQAVRATQHYADQYGVRLERACDSADARVSLDADRIIQGVVNLLSNAAKFSPAGGLVSVSLKQLPEYPWVSAVDSGTGIPENFRDRIFQRFAQADSSDRRQKGGTGLGLNICKSIIEAHKGRIDFVSEAGKGCEFYFDLPIAAQGRIQVWQ